MSTLTLPLVFTLADGETREAQTWPLGDYTCPWCSGAVLSPDGWAESQRLNAECYARTGEDYTVQPYPRSMAATWEARECPNPACLVNMDAGQLAATRARITAREAEQARQARNNELAMERIREYREAEQTRYDTVMAQCDAEGKCRPCAAHRLRTAGPLRLIAHRDPANCPVARRYAS